MDRILIGLRNFSIKKVLSYFPIHLEVEWQGKAVCPHCGSTFLWIKDTFWRAIKSLPHNGRASTLRVKCHKYHCQDCGRYFNTRMEGVKKWGRSTEVLKRDVFRQYNNGSSNKIIAKESGIGVASAERYYHQMIHRKNKQRSNRQCPRILGIDEHRFTKRKRFLTTFCDLEKHNVFDVAEGRSSAELHNYLSSLKGRYKVKVVCIDMNSTYRSLVRKWFPNAKIVADRFHVIALINKHFSKTCRLIDEDNLAYGRGGLVRMMQTRRQKLTEKQRFKLKQYLSKQPMIEALYNFCQELCDLFRVKHCNKIGCKEHVQELLVRIKELHNNPFGPMNSLGKTLKKWLAPVSRLFRYTRSNGITEGFHRKMKLIQRRAYGFRNFENYRLRVKVLCG